MTKFFMVALISCFGLGAMAGSNSQNTGECDRPYAECADQSSDQTGAQQSENYGTWVCYADNLIVKGFIGVSSDRTQAMDKAMARCANNSQLPCFESGCRQE